MADVYPINKVSVTLDHKGGTKSYQLIMLSSLKTSRTLVILRWGKTRSLSNMDVKICNSISEGEKVFEGKLREKQGRGYSPTKGIIEDEILSNAELAKKVGIGIFPKLGAAAIRHLDPDYNTGILPDASEAPRWSEDGINLDAQREEERWREVKALHEKELQRIAEQKKAEEDAKRQRFYKNNPIYGMF